MNTKVSREVNGPLIKGLRELVEYVIEEGDDRIMVLDARTKLFQDAEKQGKELSSEEKKGVSRITPSPGVRIIDAGDPGGLEWRFHILHREQDLQEQLKYLRYLVNDIRARITDLETEDVMLSFEAKERTMRFYIDSAEEMGVSIHEDLMKEWLPKEELAARQIS